MALASSLLGRQRRDFVKRALLALWIIKRLIDYNVSGTSKMWSTFGKAAAQILFFTICLYYPIILDNFNGI